MIGSRNRCKNLNIFFNVDDIITTSLIKVLSELKTIARSVALLPKPSTIDSLQNLVLVMEYHPNFRDIPKLIRDHLSILYESPCMKKVSSNDKTLIRTGFRRTKNLKDLLVPSALLDLNRTYTLNSDVVGCFRCDRKVCDACHNFLLPSNRIKVWQQEKVIKSDLRYLAAQITLFIVLYVCPVIDSVLGRQLIFVIDFPTTRIILSRKRGRAV